jgi:peroxiredoxin Q/BCP
MPIEEGKPAPAFTLKNQDGDKVSLSQFKGKQAVVLYFYPQDDTPGCTKEACGFRDYHRELQKMGVAVLGVSGDAEVSHQKFIAKYKLNFPLLSDPDKKVMTAYGAYGEKMMYGKKTTGVIRSTVLIGKDGKVLRHWARVASAEKHPEQVMAVAKELVGS